MPNGHTYLCMAILIYIKVRVFQQTIFFECVSVWGWIGTENYCFCCCCCCFCWPYQACDPRTCPGPCGSFWALAFVALGFIEALGQFSGPGPTLGPRLTLGPRPTLGTWTYPGPWAHFGPCGPLWARGANFWPIGPTLCPYPKNYYLYICTFNI